MSMTQSSFDYNNTNNTANTAGGAVPNAEFDLKDAQLDEASASNEGNFGPGNILGGGIGNLTQQATQVVSS